MRTETLSRIDVALSRLAAGEYGACVDCKGRLRHGGCTPCRSRCVARAAKSGASRLRVARGSSRSDAAASRCFRISSGREGPPVRCACARR